MTSELSAFAARVCRFIENAESGTRSAERAGWPKPSHPLSEAAFNELALELFGRQFVNNAPYRRICEARGLSPENVEHWTHAPAVPTAAFKELELTCLAPADRTVVFHSSGTTAQQPSRHFHNSESLAVYDASLVPWFLRHVVPDLKSQISNLELAILTPPPAQAPHSSLVHMFETARRESGAPDSSFLGRVGAGGSWELELDRTLRALRSACERATPLVFLGTAFSFVHLLDCLNDQKLFFQLPPGSRVMETGGYKGRSRALPKAELHALITERLAIPPSRIVCEYGMSELCSQAYDLGIQKTEAGRRKTEARGRKPERHFHFPPWARVQIISPETGREVANGETGLIRVFDLANVFSVMAIQTEDLGVRRGGGFELVGRAARTEPRGCSLLAA
jgi:hypothetical protein